MTCLDVDFLNAVARKSRLVFVLRDARITNATWRTAQAETACARIAMVETTH